MGAAVSVPAAAAGSSFFDWEGDAALKEKSSELIASIVLPGQQSRSFCLGATDQLHGL